MGYMHMGEESEKSFDNDGYFKSGDIGEFDDNDDPEISSPSGFLKITGRIKDLIVTAGGENVAPTIIENSFLQVSNAISSCFVIGDKRKYLTMLVALKVLHDGGAPKDELSKEALDVSRQLGSPAKSYSEVKDDQAWTKYIEDKVKELNSKAVSNAQKIQQWKWLPHDFSQETGELTPTLKLKRSAVAEKYRDLIDSMYKS